MIKETQAFKELYEKMSTSKEYFLSSRDVKEMEEVNKVLTLAKDAIVLLDDIERLDEVTLTAYYQTMPLSPPYRAHLQLLPNGSVVLYTLNTFMDSVTFSAHQSLNTFLYGLEKFIRMQGLTLHKRIMIEPDREFSEFFDARMGVDPFASVFSVRINFLFQQLSQAELFFGRMEEAKRVNIHS